MVDFIDDLKKDITDALIGVSNDWAEYNAIISLSTVLPKVRIIEKENPISLNLIMLMIGPPGIKKSMPLFSFTYPIIRETEGLLETTFILPSRSSVPGLIKYVTGEMDYEAENKEKKSKEVKVLVPHNEGIIIRDEFSGMFTGMRKEGWQSDGLEFISEMYDGIYQMRATTTHGLNSVDDLYAGLISCSTYYFITKMDPEFFTQGTGNRFLWCHYSAEDYEIVHINQDEYFKESWAEMRDNVIAKHAKRLEKIYNKNLQNIYVNDEAGKLWADYHYKCEVEWKTRAIEDPTGWDYHPVKRYAELALKLSGIYAISRQIDIIPRMPPDHLSNISIVKEDMKKALNLVERNREHFKTIVSIKRKNIPTESPKSQIEGARSMLIPLANSKHQMLTMGEWMDLVTTVTNHDKRSNLKQICITKGWVEIVESTPEIREMLEVTSPNAHICKYIKGL